MVGPSTHLYCSCTYPVYQIQDKDEDLCRAISERTGESLEEVHKLSLQEKRELAQALGLEQVPP